jgi:hypothetical protein
MKRPSERAPAPGEEAGAPINNEAANLTDRDAAGTLQTEAVPRIGMLGSLDELPAVREYLDSIGAVPTEIDRAGVSEMVDGYPKVVGRVIFAADGTVTVSGKAPPPTDDQAAAIIAAFKNITLPQPHTLTCVGQGPEGLDLNSRDVFICHDFDRRVAMIHQRYEKKGGGKGYVPWTQFNDGKWRKLEPSVLPFFNLPGAREHSTLFLHEGPKAPARIKRLLTGEESAERFPWLEEVRWGAHVGWLGGVHALDRSDWARLASMRWKRVIIFADNDDKGLKAAREVAGFFSANVWLCAFDGRFDPGFDLADPLPDEMFDKAGRFTGSPLNDFMIPATKATMLVPVQGRGRPAAVLRDEFAPLVAYTTQPPRIIFRHNPSRDRRPEEFNICIAPFSVVKDTAAKIHERIECWHDRMVYLPGHPSGTLTIDGARCFNVYEGAAIKPSNGDPGPWLEFIEHLFPDAAERNVVMRWTATLIAEPKVRMRYGLLLISARQGVGKNTFGAILRTQLGPSNVSFPAEGSVVDSAFNGWAARKRLIFIGEFYSGQSRKAYDRLKPLITDDLLEVNEKGVNQYELDNWATVIACSNSEAALHLDDEDRRWFVPTVAEALKPKDWWASFHCWLAGDGPGIIRRWATQYVREHGAVGTGDHAPPSKRKRAITEASRSEGQQLAVEFAESLVALDFKAIVPVGEVRKWIALQRGFRRGDGTADVGERRLERPGTITTAMKKVEGVTVWADGLRPKIAGTRQAVVMNFTPDPEASWADLKQHLTDLEGVKLDEPL